MDTKKNQILYLIILISCSYLFYGCPSNECDDLQDVRLKLLADFGPLVDTFAIGDTVSISSYFPDSIWDINNQQYTFIPNFNFHTLIVVRRFEDGEAVEVGTEEEQITGNSVNFSFQNYSLSRGTGIEIEEHNYIDNQYYFDLRYILQKKGLYVIGIDALIGFSNSLDNQSFPGQCKNQDISAVYHRPKENLDDNLENYNFQMFRDSESSIYANFSEEDFRKIAWYAFYVKE